MNISTLAGLNLPQWPTSVKDIHICYLQYSLFFVMGTVAIMTYFTAPSYCIFLCCMYYWPGLAFIGVSFTTSPTLLYGCYFHILIHGNLKIFDKIRYTYDYISMFCS